MEDDRWILRRRLLAGWLAGVVVGFCELMSMGRGRGCWVVGWDEVGDEGL